MALGVHTAIDMSVPDHVQVAAVLPAAGGAWDVWLLSKQGQLQCWAAGAVPEDVRLLEAQHEHMLEGSPGLQVRHCWRRPRKVHMQLAGGVLMTRCSPVLAHGHLDSSCCWSALYQPLQSATALRVLESPPQLNWKICLMHCHPHPSRPPLLGLSQAPFWQVNAALELLWMVRLQSPTACSPQGSSQPA